MSNRKKTLSTLLSGIVPDNLLQQDDIVTGISQDSRHIEQGDVFIALATDCGQRQRHLAQAVEQGCALILTEHRYPLTPQAQTLLRDQGVAHIPVDGLAMHAGEIAARFYDHPSTKLTVFAVTGTNGKTSVSHFIAQSLEIMGAGCGMIGTLGAGRHNALAPTGMTTPDPVSVQRLLAGFCDQGVDYAVIEASSHGLAQGRLNHVEIDIAILTNLTRDHLDYHHNLTHYAAAKARLFEFASVKAAVLNLDDGFGKQLHKKLSAQSALKLLGYCQHKEVSADFYSINEQMTAQGLSFDVVNQHKQIRINSPLYGQFNISNLLATMAALTAAGRHFDEVAAAAASCHAVAGRMEVVATYRQVQIMIDFAHTPDALEQVLQSLQAHLTGQGEIWCVFGCGGERDTGKRPLMGKVAAHYADHIVLTNDNPRGEDSRKIIDDILAGIREQHKVTVEQDRRAAIAYALRHAGAGDQVLIAGKGHEPYQEIAGVKYPFSDQQVVQSLLHDREAG